MRNRIERILLVTAVFALAGALAWTPPAAAGNVTFTLYGDNNNGWGFTASTETNPGPALSATVGDNVTLVLRSTDGNNYRWYLDVNNDSTRQGTEPRSPNFGTNAVTWNFTANTVGTFRYRAQSDPGAMWGMFTVSNVTTQPPSGGGTPLQLDTTLMIVIGVVLGFVAVLVVVGAVSRKKQQEKKKA